MKNRVAAAILGGLFIIGLAACDGESKEAEKTTTSAAPAAPASAVFDASLADKSCEIVSSDLVARTFAVPADELVQENYWGCSYEWEGEASTLEATFKVSGIYESADAAAEYFRRATRSMSSAEVGDAMSAVRAQAGSSGELETSQEQAAADDVAGAIGGNAIQFADVEGVGDAARIGTATGELIVLQDNLVFTVSAYHGSGDMPLPEKITAESMMAASKAWTRQTMPERRQGAIKLANAAIKAMKSMR